MKVEKVAQTFKVIFSMEEEEARRLQTQIANARRMFMEKEKKTGREENYEELSRFLDLLTHQIPEPWQPEEA